MSNNIEAGSLKRILPWGNKNQTRKILASLGQLGTKSGNFHHHSTVAIGLWVKVLITDQTHLHSNNFQTGYVFHSIYIYVKDMQNFFLRFSQQMQEDSSVN